MESARATAPSHIAPLELSELNCVRDVLRPPGEKSSRAVDIVTSGS